jgi:nicotinate-nucleotide pyrophosphorylase
VAEVQKPSQSDEAYFNAAADYIMLDNQDIYAYLSEY